MTTGNFCFYLQNRLIQTSKTGGQWYSDTSHFSIPWPNSQMLSWAEKGSAVTNALAYLSVGVGDDEKKFYDIDTCP
jgi:hypothetical protein